MGCEYSSNPKKTFYFQNWSNHLKKPWFGFVWSDFVNYLRFARSFGKSPSI